MYWAVCDFLRGDAPTKVTWQDEPLLTLLLLAERDRPESIVRLLSYDISKNRMIRADVESASRSAEATPTQHEVEDLTDRTDDPR